MRQSLSSRRFLLAAVASGSVLMAAHAAMAQTVRIFEQAPSLEQLRSIMIPESRGGMARTIVLQRPDAAMTRPSAVHHAAAQAEETPVIATPAVVPDAAEPVPARPVVHAAMPVAKPAPAAQTQQPVPEAGIVGFRINFAFNSAELPANAQGFINRIAELMRQEPQIKLRVEGHTDATGSQAYNLSLSEQRALAVAQYLVDHEGIAADRLVLIGKGMAEPLTQDPYAPQNRRVQFVRVS